jgi:hypothetical protein
MVARGGEPDPLAVQLALKDRDPVTEGQDLGVLGPITHRAKSQHRQRVGHAETGKSKQHDQASSPTGRRRCDQPARVDGARSRRHGSRQP